MKSRLHGVLVLAGVALITTACGLVRERDPEPRPAVVEPVEAFEEAGPAERAPVGPGPSDVDGLSSDIERLQDARRLYEHDKSQEDRELRRRQAECLSDPESHKAPVNSGAGDDVFCQDTE